MTPIEEIGKQLREARQRKETSLEEVSSATRINIIFLRDIENGIVPNVPPTYVRAFIKAYAFHVDLDAEELLRLFQTTSNPPPSQHQSASAETHMHAGRQTGRIQQEDIKQNTSSVRPHRQTMLLLIVIVVLMAGLIAILYMIQQEHKSRNVQEISFYDSTQEQTVRTHQASADSVLVALPRIPQEPDSLHLDAVASESVWVQISIDGKSMREYMLSPARTIHWDAKSGFSISVGNAKGISFMLNGQKLGTLGPNRKPLKNVTITSETLQKIGKAAIVKGKG